MNTRVGLRRLTCVIAAGWVRAPEPGASSCCRGHRSLSPLSGRLQNRVVRVPYSAALWGWSQEGDGPSRHTIPALPASPTAPLSPYPSQTLVSSTRSGNPILGRYKYLPGPASGKEVNSKAAGFPWKRLWILLLSPAGTTRSAS